MDIQEKIKDIKKNIDQMKEYEKDDIKTYHEINKMDETEYEESSWGVVWKNRKSALYALKKSLDAYKKGIEALNSMVYIKELELKDIRENGAD